MEHNYAALRAIIDRVNLIYLHREREHYVDLLGLAWQERREHRDGT